MEQRTDLATGLCYHMTQQGIRNSVCIAPVARTLLSQLFFFLLSTVEILLVVELTSEPETVVVTFVFVVTVTVSPGNMSWAAEHKGKEAAATRIGRDSRVLMFGCMIIVKNSFQEVGLFLPTYWKIKCGGCGRH